MTRRGRLAAGLASLALAASLAPVTASAEPGVAEDYLLHCSACHGLDGRGTPGVTPGLHDLAELLALEGGRAYLVRVPGVAQAPLSDARLARLLNHVLERFSAASAGPAHAPFRAEEVGALRRHPLRDPQAARPADSGPASPARPAQPDAGDASDASGTSSARGVSISPRGSM